MFADPAQAGRARVALADGVRGDQAEGPLVPQQVESTAKEVGHKIGVAVRVLVDRLEPVGITGRMPNRERVLARERRVAHKRIKPRILSVEHLRELNLPVKGKDRMRSTAEPADGCLEPLMARHVELAALGGEVLRQRLEPLLPFPIVVGREEGGNDEVAIAASRVNKPVGGREPLAQESFGRAVGRFANLSALVHRPIELPLDGRSSEVALLLGLPVEAQDLRLA